MEKPDSNGFINVNWPSKNIPHGGIFHTHIANPTEDQQKFLKVLIEESKLTLEQNQKNPLSLRQHDEKKLEQVPQVRKQMVRPRTSRRRSLSEIRQSGAFDFDKYRPLKRGEDRELMKEKLAYKMTYGDNEEQTKPKPLVAPRKKTTDQKLPTNKEKWNELVTQIRERTEWLAEMEYLGYADPHRDIIKDQIAERMRALDALGVDSECSTARTNASGFSTLRSRESILKGDNVPASVHSSIHSGKSVTAKRVRGRDSKREENVASYAQLSPLIQTPRRRQ